MVTSRNARAVANLGMASVLTIFLGACSSMSLPSFSSSPSVAPEPGPTPEMPASIRPDEIVGRWGLASFQNPNDRARTEAAARAQCKQPYVIGAGSTGGVIMHLADQATPQELRLKGSPSGKNYIGPPGPAGGEQDREIVSFDGRVLITPLHRQGCGDPLRQHGLCPLRAAGLISSLRGANGSRECAPDDRLRDEAIHYFRGSMDCFATLAMTT